MSGASLVVSLREAGKNETHFEGFLAAVARGAPRIKKSKGFSFKTILLCGTSGLVCEL